MICENSSLDIKWKACFTSNKIYWSVSIPLAHIYQIIGFISLAQEYQFKTAHAQNFYINWLSSQPPTVAGRNHYIKSSSSHLKIARISNNPQERSDVETSWMISRSKTYQPVFLGQSDIKKKSPTAAWATNIKLSPIIFHIHNKPRFDF
jgi:hypothetical protein